MRKLRNDLPYTFKPPTPRRWLSPLTLAVNRSIHLGRKYRIARIDEQGFNAVREAVNAGHAVLLAPNHSDHSDPHVLMEVGSRHGLRPLFMAARELFEVHPVVTWALQSTGVFSVDRDGADLSAIKTAMSLLEKGGQPLVIFPEGEIYHHHRRLDPLNEGVASILLKVAARLEAPQRALLFPVAMQFFHDPIVEATFSQRLSRLEDRIGWQPRPAMEVDDRIRRLGSGVLALKETEYLGEASQGAIHERLGLMCDALLNSVEQRHARDAKAGTPPERVRALRYRIRRRLLDAESPPDAKEHEFLLDDLDRVFTALQAHSYIGDYLMDDASLDRRAETIMKLEEDLLGFPTYPIGRSARVVADRPMDVTAMLADGSIPTKQGAVPLTDLLEARLGEMLAEPRM